jgi:VanZ family protein
MARHRSSAVPLAWLYAALIVYASLYPFTGWRQARSGPLDFLLLPWPRWWSGSDLTFNLLGYLPLGLLVCLACVRGGQGRSSAFLVAAGLATLLSFSMELLQNFLPNRVPSNVDLGLNVLGAAAGAGLGLVVHAAGGVARWQTLRERWFVDRSAGGLALLLLWPVALLFPAPVVLGMGQVFPLLKDALAEVLADTAAQPWVEDWLLVEAQFEVLTPGSEVLAIALGLLAPCLVAFSFTRPGWRRVGLACGLALVGFSTTTLSTALNFGPQHALAWLTGAALLAILAGSGLAFLLSWVPGRAAAGLGLIVLTALVALVAQAPTDPYFAQSLQAWEQGRFIRFHGAARWVGWLWPFAALAYLFARVAARDEA